MIIYRGCELEHWREPYWGKNHAQVFLHYNEKNGQYDIPNDGRPILGMPATFRDENAVEMNDVDDAKNTDILPNEQFKSDDEIKKVIY